MDLDAALNLNSMRNFLVDPSCAGSGSRRLYIHQVRGGNMDSFHILAIDHVVLRTKRVHAMVEFYCDKLGCTIERTLEKEGLIQLRAGNALIDLVDVEGMLGKKGGRAPEGTGHNMDHFCLLISSIEPEALFKLLEQKGFRPDEMQTRYGATGFGLSVYLQDPDGNTVELKPSK